MKEFIIATILKYILLEIIRIYGPILKEKWNNNKHQLRRVEERTCCPCGRDIFWCPCCGLPNIINIPEPLKERPKRLKRLPIQSRIPSARSKPLKVYKIKTK